MITQHICNMSPHQKLLIKISGCKKFTCTVLYTAWISCVFVWMHGLCGICSVLVCVHVCACVCACVVASVLVCDVWLCSLGQFSGRWKGTVLSS